MYKYTPKSVNSSFPVAWPYKINAAHAFIDSELDSWLLPSAKLAWPLAHECPSYVENTLKYGYFDEESFLS